VNDILVAGIGNIFFGDDAFGVEVAQRLSRRKLPENVNVVDFGIRGFDLAFALMDERYRVAILVDALPRGEAPGTLYTMEPDLSDIENSLQGFSPVDTHGMTPMRVFQLVQSMGGKPGRILIVGCEPETLGTEEEGKMGLSPCVDAAVDSALDLVESLIEKIEQGVV
jgi:hydrogenase maturation protease